MHFGAYRKCMNSQECSLYQLVSRLRLNALDSCHLSGFEQTAAHVLAEDEYSHGSLNEHQSQRKPKSM